MLRTINNPLNAECVAICQAQRYPLRTQAEVVEAATLLGGKLDAGIFIRELSRKVNAAISSKTLSYWAEEKAKKEKWARAQRTIVTHFGRVLKDASIILPKHTKLHNPPKNSRSVIPYFISEKNVVSYYQAHHGTCVASVQDNSDAEKVLQNLMSEISGLGKASAFLAARATITKRYHHTIHNMTPQARLKLSILATLTLVKRIESNVVITLFRSKSEMREARAAKKATMLQVDDSLAIEMVRPAIKKPDTKSIRQFDAFEAMASTGEDAHVSDDEDDLFRVTPQDIINREKYLSAQKRGGNARPALAPCYEFSRTFLKLMHDVEPNPGPPKPDMRKQKGKKPADTKPTTNRGGNKKETNASYRDVVAANSSANSATELGPTDAGAAKHAQQVAVDIPEPTPAKPQVSFNAVPKKEPLQINVCGGDLHVWARGWTETLPEQDHIVQMPRLTPAHEACKKSGIFETLKKVLRWYTSNGSDFFGHRDSEIKAEDVKLPDARIITTSDRIGWQKCLYLEGWFIQHALSVVFNIVGTMILRKVIPYLMNAESARIFRAVMIAGSAVSITPSLLAMSTVFPQVRTAALKAWPFAFEKMCGFVREKYTYIEASFDAPENVLADSRLQGQRRCDLEAVSTVVDATVKVTHCYRYVCPSLYCGQHGKIETVTSSYAVLGKVDLTRLLNNLMLTGKTVKDSVNATMISFERDPTNTLGRTLMTNVTATRVLAYLFATVNTTHLNFQPTVDRPSTSSATPLGNTM